MTPFFEPNPILLAFVLLKTSVYLPVVLALALVRAAVSRGASRNWALLAVVIAVAGIAARFGPALLGLTGGALAQASFAFANAGGGMVVALLASVPLAVSAIMPERRWLVLDGLHGLLVSALFVLWLLAQ